MKMNKINLTNQKCDCYYTGAVYTNNSYKFLNSCIPTIDIFNCNLTKISSQKICDICESITYADNYYYVIKKNQYDKIYVLDNKFIEVDIINLNIPSAYRKKILSINIDLINSRFIITLENMVYSTNLQGDFIKDLLSKCTIDEIKNSCKQIQRVGCNYVRNVSSIKLTSAAVVCSKLYITYIKNKSLYLSEISPNGNIIKTYFVDDYIYCRQIFCVNKEVNLLCLKENKYNYLYNFEKKCNKFPCSSNEFEIIKSCEKRIDLCCGEKKHCDNELCDIIESIALIENSLAAILCSESEKISRAVQIACSPKELVCVNDSVAKTITSVTMLEQVLIEKLNIALDKRKC